MIKAWQSHNASHQKTIKKIKSHRFTIFLGQKKENFFRSISQNNIRSSNSGNDIFLSPSGQVKIDNLASCRTLGCCDFIVF